MDFQLVLKRLLAAFALQKIRYALIGGVALGLWGVPRATVDLDFLIEMDDLPQVHAILSDLGYSCHYQSQNVSQYTSDLQLWGQIDILHACRQASRGMLERAVVMRIIQETVAIRVVRVEDLIGLKVQALVNDPSRSAMDQADIEALLEAHSRQLDWSLLQGYFDLFQQQTLYEALKDKYVPFH
ncbi:MAG: nucleotidyltransferase family protein [Desulfobacca sp.]|uniref:nucleotidyltransferase family protein n=1 Tax=Desulfobacca sp. TaxID=2067990 RepID=UPI00404ADFD7